VTDKLKSYIETNLGFPYINQVFIIDRVRSHLDGSNTTSERAYGITSLTSAQATPKDLLSYNRNHWEIENRIHYVRDVTYDEDRCRIRKGTGARIMASLRNTSIGLLRKAGCTYIPQGIRSCSWNNKNKVFRLIGIA
jgi:predicted transposase YbfD/YdcC